MRQPNSLAVALPLDWLTSQFFTFSGRLELDLAPDTDQFLLAVRLTCLPGRLADPAVTIQRAIVWSLSGPCLSVYLTTMSNFCRHMVTLPERASLSLHSCQTYVSRLCLEVQIRWALEWVQSCLPTVWCQDDMWLWMTHDILYKADRMKSYFKLVVWCDMMWLHPSMHAGPSLSTDLCCINPLYSSRDNLGSWSLFFYPSKWRLTETNLELGLQHTKNT